MGSSSGYPSGGGETISIDHGFAALRHFLNAYWERGGKPEDSMINLLSSIERGIWADGGPGDPAMWSDWLDAIEVTRKKSEA